MTKNKPLVATITALSIALVIGIIFAVTRPSVKPVTVVTEDQKPELPVNVIPITDRPFVTLTPDSIGRNLMLFIDRVSDRTTMDYEVVYKTAETEQGGFGRFDLANEKIPLTKNILLGSRSAGGATTYYEGITSGTLTLTYNDTKLRESFNFLRFSADNPDYSTTDGRFAITLSSKALKKNDVVLMTKTFGLPLPLPSDKATLVAGPYTYQTPTVPKGVVTISITMPAGDHTNPTVYELVNAKWSKLKATVKGDVVVAVPTANVFIVTEE